MIYPSDILSFLAKLVLVAFLTHAVGGGAQTLPGTEDDKRRQVNLMFNEAVEAFKAKHYQRAMYLGEQIRLIELPGETKYLSQAKQIIDSARIKQKEEYDPFLKIAADKIQQGDFVGARSLCAAMRRKDPDYPRILDCLKVAREQSGELDLESPVAQDQGPVDLIDPKKVTPSPPPVAARPLEKTQAQKMVLPVVDIEFISEPAKNGKKSAAKTPQIKLPLVPASVLKSTSRAEEGSPTLSDFSSSETYQKAIAAFFRAEYSTTIALSNEIKNREGQMKPGGYYEQADRLIDKAKTLRRKSMHGLLLRAEEKYAGRDYKSARQLCEQILETDPNFEDARNFLRKINSQLN